MRISFTGTFHVAKLADDLMAAIPALRPVPGEDGILVHVCTVDATEAGVVVVAPDEANQKAIAAVVKAHDPTPPPALKTKQERAREALATVDGAKLTAETRKLLAVLEELVED